MRGLSADIPGPTPLCARLRAVAKVALARPPAKAKRQAGRRPVGQGVSGAGRAYQRMFRIIRVYQRLSAIHL